MDSKYWSDLYTNNDTGWDIGFPSTPLKTYIYQLTKKDLAILIPGCGNAHEAGYLLSQGFSNITLIDFVRSLTAKLEKRFSNEVGKRVRVVTGDFFDHQGKYDLILEQTFLSALEPSRRPQYVDTMHSLLKEGGHLAGVLFSKVFDEAGPPFGGTIDEYEKMFKDRFIIKTLEPCYNSIERRQGSEVFINMIAK